jgi:NADH dehydrogenase FAD-containing subunit
VVPSHPDIFVVGDTATVTDQPGIPGTAPAAKQMGRYVGQLIAARVAGEWVPGAANRSRRADFFAGVGGGRYRRGRRRPLSQFSGEAGGKVPPINSPTRPAMDRRACYHLRWLRPILSRDQTCQL